jgi:hypothetical protein
MAEDRSYVAGRRRARRRLAQRLDSSIDPRDPPRDAAAFALRIAEQTDALVAELPLDRLYPDDPDSPIYTGRWEHRGEHLDEIEAALRARR